LKIDKAKGKEVRGKSASTLNFQPSTINNQFPIPIPIPICYKYIIFYLTCKLYFLEGAGGKRQLTIDN